MKNYKEVYEYHEENGKIHKGIAEVEQVEQELTDALAIIVGEQKLKDTLDTLFGKIARAYEIQGFVFGYDLATQEVRI